MKKYLFLNIIFCLLLAACKKEQVTKTSADVPATPAQLAVVADSLKGSWGYVFGIEYFYNTGLPGLNDFPFNASVIINDTSPLTTVDYDGNASNIPYTLSGVNGTFYLNIQRSAADNRKLKIVKLTADSLITQNTITGVDTSSKAIFIEKFFRAHPVEVEQKQFKITFSNPQSSADTLNVYITPKGGAEKLVAAKSNFTQYSYSYIPAIGDHIRAEISFSYFITPFTTLAFYKGLPYGDGWEYTSLSMGSSHAWDINN